jgi:hypothetical protein
MTKLYSVSYKSKIFNIDNVTRVIFSPYPPIGKLIFSCGNTWKKYLVGAWESSGKVSPPQGSTRKSKNRCIEEVYKEQFHITHIAPPSTQPSSMPRDFLGLCFLPRGKIGTQWIPASLTMWDDAHVVQFFFALPRTLRQSYQQKGKGVRTHSNQGMELNKRLQFLLTMLQSPPRVLPINLVDCITCGCSTDPHASPSALWPLNPCPMLILTDASKLLNMMNEHMLNEWPAWLCWIGKMCLPFKTKG